MIVNGRLTIPLVVLFAASVFPAMAQDLMDKGVFAIYREGKPLGSEEFDISLLAGKGSIQTRTSYRITSNGQSQEISLQTRLLLDAGLVPQRYELTGQGGGQKQTLEIDFKPRLAMCVFDLGTEKKTEAVIVPPDSIILDQNVFAHWAMVLLRCAQNQSDKQALTVFVPQLGNAGVGLVNVLHLGKETVAYGAGKAKAAHFRVTSPELAVDVWRDSTGRVLKIQVPANNAEVIRLQ